jgi:hypothetical protein
VSSYVRTGEAGDDRLNGDDEIEDVESLKPSLQERPTANCVAFRLFRKQLINVRFAFNYARFSRRTCNHGLTRLFSKPS